MIAQKTPIKTKKSNSVSNHTGRKNHSNLKFFIMFILSLLLFPASVLVAFICMLPTIITVLKDEQRYPFKWVTMGCTNLAGTLIPLTNLWFASNNFEMALYLLNPVSNSGTYVGAYLGAYIGLLIYKISPIICDFIIRVIIQKRMIELRLLEKELRDEWIKDDEVINKEQN